MNRPRHRRRTGQRRWRGVIVRAIARVDPQDQKRAYVPPEESVTNIEHVSLVAGSGNNSKEFRMYMNATGLQTGIDNAAPIPATPSQEPRSEAIGGYQIHPFASRFPLLQGERFEELVQSIASMGIDVPIELSNGLVTDGRNRLRAVEALRERGSDVEVRTVEWQPRHAESVEEHIFAANVHRRHLTDDQRAMLATELLQIARAESAARQRATQFGSAAMKSTPPDSDSATTPRTSRDKLASSTLGRLAKTAGVTEHKMGRAIELADNIAAGLVPQKERDAVISGKKPLRKVGPKNPRRPATTKKPAVQATLDTVFESPDQDEAPSLTLDDFSRRWDRLKAAYPVTEHRELRRLALQHIADEQRRFDQR